MNPLEYARLGSEPGYPLVLYFHHISPDINHYTALTPSEFGIALEFLLKRFDKIIDPRKVNPVMDIPNCPSVLITFDDGYKDNIEYGVPILDSFGVKSLFFVTVKGINQEKIFIEPYKNFMEWEDLERLVAEDHYIGAHSMTHRPFNLLSDKEIEYEIFESKQQIESKLNLNNINFALPYGIVPKKLPNYNNFLLFGTVKSNVGPWQMVQKGVRRTFLPTGRLEIWEELIDGWVNQWYG